MIQFKICMAVKTVINANIMSFLMKKPKQNIIVLEVAKAGRRAAKFYASAFGLIMPCLATFTFL